MTNKPKAQSQRSGKEIIDYIEALLRRPFHVGIPIVVIAVAALVASFVIPKQYQAKTLIIVEYEKVPLPNAFLPKAAPETTKRLLAITQEVLSRTRLEKVVRELDPYGSKDDGISDDVDLMRTASSVNIKGSDAFTIAYVHKDPATAQAVANRLATVFVEEASEQRSEQMAGASDFIDSEMEQARKALDARDAEIRRFKERNMGHLPEQTSANLATLQRLQSDKQVVEESLRAAMQRQSLIEQSLGASGQDTGKELVQLRGQLAALKGRYTDEHPDVRALTARIARLEKETASGNKAPPRDPALDAVRLEISTLRSKRDDTDRSIANFQARVELAPRTEQELATLMRDYQKLKDNYLALYNKRTDAQTAEKLEERWKGEHFRVVDPAGLPSRPFFPKRSMFLLVGLLLGTLAGVGVSAAAEIFDHSIKTQAELESLLSYPVMAALPYIDDAEALAATGSRERAARAGAR